MPVGDRIRTRHLMAALAAIVVAGAVAAVVGPTERPYETERSPATACREFASLQDDVEDGVLTRDEARAHARTVEDRAASTSVEDEARELVAAMTTGTAVDMDDALRAMDRAC